MKRLIVVIVYLMLFVTVGCCELPILADEQRAEFNKGDTEKAGNNDIGNLKGVLPEGDKSKTEPQDVKDKSEANIDSVQAHHTKVISQEGAQQMADSALKERNIDTSKYDMLSIEELQWSDTNAWLIVLQLKKELRQDPKKSGGEIFVKIDQNSSEVSVTYAGSEDSYQG